MMFDNPPCQGKTDLFYPPLVEFDSPHHVSELRERKEAAEAEAKAICQTCPYVEPCLEAALDGETYGIWGGKSPAERREIRIERKLIIRRGPYGNGHNNCGTEAGYQALAKEVQARGGSAAGHRVKCKACRRAHSARVIELREKRKQEQ